MPISSLAALVPAGLNFVGNLLGTSATNAANQENQQSAEAWMSNMSNTAYQRATADMKAAGLNPMLAYSQGGASSPGISAVQSQNAIGNAVNGAVSAASAGKSMEVQDAQLDQIDAQTNLADAQSSKAEEEAKQAAIETMHQQWLSRGHELWDNELRIKSAQANSSEEQAKQESLHSKYLGMEDLQHANDRSWQENPLAMYLKPIESILPSAHSLVDLSSKLTNHFFKR